MELQRDSDVPSSASRDLCRNGNLIGDEAEGVKNTNPFKQGRKVPAGGVQKWLGKVMPSEWLLSLGNGVGKEQEGAQQVACKVQPFLL